MQSQNIFYIDEVILRKIETEIDLIEKKSWYRLYQNKDDRSFWRFDEWDKYQVQIFVKLESIENWSEYNDEDLRINLLKEQRGLSSDKCKWKNCKNNALNYLVFCELHAFKEMGIRK